MPEGKSEIAVTQAPAVPLPTLSSADTPARVPTALQLSGFFSTAPTRIDT